MRLLKRGTMLESLGSDWISESLPSSGSKRTVSVRKLREEEIRCTMRRGLGKAYSWKTWGSGRVSERRISLGRRSTVEKRRRRGWSHRRLGFPWRSRQTRQSIDRFVWFPGFFFLLTKGVLRAVDQGSRNQRVRLF